MNILNDPAAFVLSIALLMVGKKYPPTVDLALLKIAKCISPQWTVATTRHAFGLPSRLHKKKLDPTSPLRVTQLWLSGRLCSF